MIYEPAVGDLVELNSGGPAMTVTRIYPQFDVVPCRAQCTWIDSEGSSHQETFPIVCVKPFTGAV